MRPLRPDEILHVKYGEIYADRNLPIIAAHLWGVPKDDSWWPHVGCMLSENWSAFRKLSAESLAGGAYITALYSEKLDD